MKTVSNSCSLLCVPCISLWDEFHWAPDYEHLCTVWAFAAPVQGQGLLRSKDCVHLTGPSGLYREGMQPVLLETSHRLPPGFAMGLRQMQESRWGTAEGPVWVQPEGGLVEGTQKLLWSRKHLEIHHRDPEPAQTLSWDGNSADTSVHEIPPFPSCGEGLELTESAWDRVVPRFQTSETPKNLVIDFF